MPYLIDGHNLIPKVPGLSLESFDDELQLIELLQEFCRLRRKQVEVFFDNAPPGGQTRHKYGLVSAQFIREGQSADDAILRRLDQLGKGARNWTVVTSDRDVQIAAKAKLADIIPSEDFARLLNEVILDSIQEGADSADSSLSPDEVEHWLDIFDSGIDQA